jgi:hypothetical protein
MMGQGINGPRCGTSMLSRARELTRRQRQTVSVAVGTLVVVFALFLAWRPAVLGLFHLNEPIAFEPGQRAAGGDDEATTQMTDMASDVLGQFAAYGRSAADDQSARSNPGGQNGSGVGHPRADGAPDPLGPSPAGPGPLATIAADSSSTDPAAVGSGSGAPPTGASAAAVLAGENPASPVTVPQATTTRAATVRTTTASVTSGPSTSATAPTTATTRIGITTETTLVTLEPVSVPDTVPLPTVPLPQASG